MFKYAGWVYIMYQALMTATANANGNQQKDCINGKC